MTSKSPQERDLNKYLTTKSTNTLQQSIKVSSKSKGNLMENYYKKDDLRGSTNYKENNYQNQNTNALSPRYNNFIKQTKGASSVPLLLTHK